MRGRQLPLEVAYAITSNRPQCQSFRCIVLDLRTQPWQHGQLCVAIRRSRNPALVKYIAEAEHMRHLSNRGGCASVVGLVKMWCSPIYCGLGPHRLS